MDEQGFKTLLLHILSGNNKLIKEATQSLENLKCEPHNLVQALFSVLMNGEAHLRIAAIAIIRRFLTLDENPIWPTLSQDLRQIVKQNYIIAIQTEEAKHIRSQICDAIAELGLVTVGENEWPELLPFMNESVASMDMNIRESGLTIYGFLSYTLAHSLSDDELDGTFDMFIGNIEDDDTPVEIKMAATRAAASTIASVSVKRALSFTRFMKTLIGLTGRLLAESHDSLNDILHVFIELLEVHPIFFKDQILESLTCMFSICKTANVDTQARQLAFEVLVTFAENLDTTVRAIADNNFANEIIPVAFEMLYDVEEDPSWSNRTPDQDDEDNMNNHAIAAEALERLCIALGHESILPLCFRQMSESMHHADWRYRYASLIAMIYLIEHMPADENQLHLIIQQVLPLLQDEVSRVRYAALKVVGEMCLEHGPFPQTHFHEVILPAIMEAITNTSLPVRVQMFACHTLAAFIENSPNDVTEMYVGQLLTTLTPLLKGSITKLKEDIILVLGCMAETCPGSMTQCNAYDCLMPMLKGIIANCFSAQERELRGRTFECAAFLGSTVSPQKFKDDAVSLLDIMTQTSQNLDADDPQKAYIWQTWGLIARSIGEEIVPFLPYVMPSLLEAARTHDLLSKSVALDDEGSWEVVPDPGNQTQGIKVNSAILDEKVTAIKQLTAFAELLKGDYVEYIDDVVQALAPLTSYTQAKFPKVRRVCVKAMSSVVECAAASYLLGKVERTYVKQLMEFITGCLLEAYNAENDIICSVGLANCIADVLRQGSTSSTPLERNLCPGAVVEPTMMQPILDSPVIRQLIQSCMEWFKRSQQRISIRLAERAIDENFDDMAERKMAKENTNEYTLHFALSEILTAIATSHPQIYVKAFQSLLLPVMNELMTEGRQPYEYRFVAFILSELFGNCGLEAAQAYMDMTVAFMLSHCINADSQMRQAAVYTLGLMSKVCGSTIAPHIPAIIQQLVQAASSEEPEMAFATDNAISSVGRVLLHQSLDNSNELSQFWMANLPLQNDQAEFEESMNMLLSLIESGKECIIQDCTGIFRVLTEAVCSDFIATDLQTRVCTTIHLMRSNMEASAFQAACSKLSEDHLGILNQILEVDV